MKGDQLLHEILELSKGPILALCRVQPASWHPHLLKGVGPDFMETAKSGNKYVEPFAFRLQIETYQIHEAICVE